MGLPAVEKKRKHHDEEGAPTAIEEPKKKKSKKQKKDKEEKENISSTPEESTSATTEELKDKSTEKKKKKKKSKNTEEDHSTPDNAESATTAKITSSAVSDEKKLQANKKDGKSTKNYADHPFYEENNITVSGRPAPKPATTFAESTLPKEINTYLEKKFGKDGKPSQIQATAWPLIMQGEDVFGIAKTGSGKSLAFVLPYLAKRLAEDAAQSSSTASKKTKRHYPRMVCLAPTKELVQQIAEVCEEFCGMLSIDLAVHCIIGGVPKHEQISKIKSRNCDVVIATPGRLLDLVENDQVLNLTKCDYFILDEADRMLDDGFILPIRKISEYAGNLETRQTVLFSATWPLEVNKLARGLIQKDKAVATITVLRKGQTLDDPDNINTEDKLQLNDAISQEIVVLEDGRKKWDHLTRALNSNKQKKILVFGLYKKEVANLETWLRQGGHKVTALQGDMTQANRTKSIEDYKKNAVRILIATDVAARGLDIPDIDMVINYTFPLTIEDFVHRCGRTGRAGKKGQAMTFFNKSGEHNEKNHCFDIVRLLEGAKQPVSKELKEMSQNTFVATKKKSHGMYGDFCKSAEQMEKLVAKQVQMTFDSDSD